MRLGDIFLVLEGNVRYMIRMYRSVRSFVTGVSITLIVFSFFLGSVFAIDYTLDASARVYDRGGVLSELVEEQIEAQLLSIEEATTAQVVVITLTDLGGRTIEEVALNFWRENGVWDGEQDTGLIVLIAIDDRQWRIEVGYGLEWVITDQQAFRLWQDVLVPRFRAGDYEGGIAAVVGQIVSVLQWEIELAQPSSVDLNASFSSIDILIFWVVVAFFFGSILSGASKTTNAKRKTAGLWSWLTWLIGVALVGWSTLWIILPLFFFWWIVLSGKRVSSWWPGRSWSSWFGWGGSFSGWGFSGFGWWSFGGWWAGGSW